MSDTKKIKYPFGKADVISKAFAAVMDVDIDINETILTIAQMTAAATLNLNIRSEVEAGSNLSVKVSVDGTNRVLTFGTGMTGAAPTLTASKSYLITFKYDGSTFTLVSTQLLN